MDTPNHILEMELRRLKARVSTLEDANRELVESITQPGTHTQELVVLVRSMSADLGRNTKVLCHHFRHDMNVATDWVNTEISKLQAQP